MPTYEYRCNSCGRTDESSVRSDILPCPSCQERMVRVFSVNPTSTFRPHFNAAVGQYVSSDRQFRDALRRGSDMQSERTGMEHRYVPIDPRDTQPMDNGAGLEEAKRAYYDATNDK